jgi:hypothetical protein
MTDTDRRRSLLVAALGFALLSAPEPVPPAITELRRWLDSWRGLGLVAGGMARQGYDLSLTRYAERGWRATFYVSGMEHAATTATESAFAPTPWAAVQRAAQDTLRAHTREESQVRRRN